jgi:thiosulfate dehydrogenase [quinone] large subunit
MASRVPPDAGRRSCHALAIVRLTLGAMFVWVFFENYGKGAYTPAGYAGVINYYLTKGHAPEVWKSVMSFMAGNAAVAGPIQAATEIAFGVLLTLGIATRLTALAAGMFLASLWVSEWGAAWIWELLVPMLAAFAVAYGAAGRVWGVDARLARRYPGSPIW